MAYGDLLASFGFTGAPETFTVPAGVGILLVQLVGANAQGVDFTTPVTPGEELEVLVGGRPTVPDTPDLDGYWTVEGGWNGGGMGRSIEQPAVVTTGDGDPRRNGYAVAGGGATELRRSGTPLGVAPGSSGGYSEGGTALVAETPPLLLTAPPSATDPPRVPLPGPVGASVVLEPVAGGDTAGADGGYEFVNLGTDLDPVYVFRIGGGGGFGGGATSGWYLDGDESVQTLARPGGAYIAGGLTGALGSSTLLDHGTVLLYDNTRPAGWSVSRIGF